MTPAQERRSRGTTLCERLTADVATIALEGIGRWERAWDIVDEPSASFMVALTAWECDPTNLARDRVREAYHQVVAAWRYAAEEFKGQEAGR